MANKMNLYDPKKMRVEIGFYVSLVVICFLSCYIQQQLFLSWDISSLLYSATRLWEGGNYVNDFFIPNTPMILYLYLPPLIVAKITHINILTIFPGYIFCLILLSYNVCCHLLNKIFLKEDFLQRYIFAGTLALIFLVVPVYEFGQRDHLLVFMTMPYLLATVCRLENQTVEKGLALLTGLLAGLAVGIKPHFLLLPLMVECTFILYQKNWLAWCKPETITILTVQAIYLAVVLITRQDYVTVIMPYLVKNYYGSSFVTWFAFLFNDVMCFVYVTIIFYLFLNKLNHYRKLSAILFVALLTFVITFMTQGFTYFYHMVPALSLAFLLIAQLFANIVAQGNLSNKDYKTIGLPAICLLLMQAYLLNLSFKFTFFDPAVFFDIFFISFAGLIFVLRFTKSGVIALVSSIILAVLTYFLAIKYSASVAYFIQIILTVFVFAVFSKIAFAKTSTRQLQLVFITLLGVSLFVIPSWIVVNVYETGLQYKRYTLNKLIDFMRTQPPHSSIYMLSSGIHYTFPMASYTDTTIAQRFDALWMVRRYIKDIVNDRGPALREEIRNNNNETLNMIVDDLRRNKPELIFVEINYEGQRSIMFNFLEYFLQNEAFQQVWENYHYYTTIEQAGAFKLQVYKRNTTA